MIRSNTRTMKNILFALIFLPAVWFPFTINAQDLHIYLDAREGRENSLVYILEGDTLTKPKVRQGRQIFFHVLNYNNYLYDLEISSSPEEIAFSGGMPFNITDLLGAATGSAGTGVLSLQGNAGFPGFSSAFTTNLKNSLEAKGDIKGYAYAENIRRIQNSLAEIERIETRMASIDTLVDGLLQSAALVELAQADLEAIKTQPGWMPADIKAQARKYLKKVFDTENPTEIDAENILRRSRIKSRLQQKIADVQDARKTFDRQVSQLSGEAALLAAIPMKDEKLREVESSLAVFMREAPELDTSFAAHLEKLTQLAEQAEDLDLNTLIRLRRNAEGILKNDFSLTYRAAAEGDQTNLSARFALRDSVSFTGERRVLQLAPLSVPVYGGFKVNASVGIGFGRFFKQPERYFVQDDVIRAESGDRFTPIITSFFHFYWQSAGNVSFGGSFGIGLPIVSSNESQSASFFLGSSLYLGRRERLVLTTGLMGGRVTRLANGLEVNDVIDLGGGVLPIYNPYELGYFVGLSFNLFGQKE